MSGYLLCQQNGGVRPSLCGMPLVCSLVPLTGHSFMGLSLCTCSAPGPVQSPRNTEGKYNMVPPLEGLTCHRGQQTLKSVVKADGQVLCQEESGNQRECPPGAGLFRGKVTFEQGFAEQERVLQADKARKSVTGKGTHFQRHLSPQSRTFRWGSRFSISQGNIPRFKALFNKPDANQTIIHLLA